MILVMMGGFKVSLECECVKMGWVEVEYGMIWFWFVLGMGDEWLCCVEYKEVGWCYLDRGCSWCCFKLNLNCEFLMMEKIYDF